MALIASHTTKFVLLGLLLMVVYSSMVMDIIQIKKVHENSNLSGNLPGAVIAMLVAAILQCIWCTWYLIRGGRGAMFKASNVAAATLFFFLFQLGAVIAATVLRYDNNYCPRDASNFTDCRGVMRGTIGLGFSTVGLSLIYLIYLALLVPKYGNWATDMYNIPARVHPNSEFMKESAH